MLQAFETTSLAAKKTNAILLERKINYIVSMAHWPTLQCSMTQEKIYKKIFKTSQGILHT